MSTDRIAALEQRCAALAREAAELREIVFALALTGRTWFELERPLKDDENARIEATLSKLLTDADLPFVAHRR